MTPSLPTSPVFYSSVAQNDSYSIHPQRITYLGTFCIFYIGFFCCLLFLSLRGCQDIFNVSFRKDHWRSKLRSRDISFVNDDVAYWTTDVSDFRS